MVAAKRWDVVKKDTKWVAEDRQGNTQASGRTKAAAVKATAAAAKKADGAVSVRIHGTDGKIQEERTYPRLADPRSSKG